MKTIITLALLATLSYACITPIQPIPPIGCSAGDATLITNSDGTCYWVFIGC